MVKYTSQTVWIMKFANVYGLPLENHKFITWIEGKARSQSE